MSDPGAAPQAPRRILFTTSNGTGLGHLTRSMAIAARLGPDIEPLFLTLSAAAPVVADMGYPVEYVPSYGTPGSGNDYRWSRRLRARLRAVIAQADPAVIVFDGTHPYEALLGALGSAGVAVWCRRPLWKEGSSRVPLGRAGAFDAVLEPGELAESEDRGPTVALRAGAHRVEPVVLLERADRLDRAAAEAELGLAPGRTNVLVTLGQGAEVSEASRRTLAALAGREEVQVAALASTLTAAEQVPEGVVQIRSTYPMSRYFAAFDAAVAAAGYNAYHELVALGVPSLFVPMPRLTDDQPARARYAEAAGLGLALGGPEDAALETQLERLLDPVRRETIRGRLDQLPEPGGATQAAAWLTELAAGRGKAPAAQPGPGAGRQDSGREFRRRWGQFFGSLPQTASRLTRQTLTQSRARTLILAVGVDAERVADGVQAALSESGEEPRRALVVTDALAALGRLRALGVGVEHIPAAGSRQHELAGGSPEDFARARLGLIQAERPSPRRVISLPASLL